MGKIDSTIIKLEKWREVMCMKLSYEINDFKRREMNKTVEEVFADAFVIEMTLNLYEYLLEELQKLSEEEIMKLLFFPNLLGFLFDRWNREPDSFAEEMETFLEKELKILSQVNWCE